MPEGTDATFYRSPTAAIAAPAEELAYVAAFDPAGEQRDAMTVVDCDPESSSYLLVREKRTRASPEVGVSSASATIDQAAIRSTIRGWVVAGDESGPRYGLSSALLVRDCGIGGRDDLIAPGPADPNVPNLAC